MTEALRLLSIDHGAHDLAPVATALGADPARIPAFKTLAVAAAARVAQGRSGFGMFLDGDLGGEALLCAKATGLWCVRQFPHGQAGGLDEFRAWPRHVVVKLIANGRSDALIPLARRLEDIHAAMPLARGENRQVLIEALPGEGVSTAEFMAMLYADDIRPDYWLIECQQDEAAYRAIAATITRHDPACRGSIVIARSPESGPDLAYAAGMAGVIGFVGGRSIFGAAMKAWLSGAADDQGAIDAMAARFGTLAAAFDSGLVERRASS
jgi:5-dehydro-2-deoxygluconokinase